MWRTCTSNVWCLLVLQPHVNWLLINCACDCVSAIHVPVVSQSGLHSLAGRVPPRHQATESTAGPWDWRAQTLWFWKVGWGVSTWTLASFQPHRVAPGWSDCVISTCAFQSLPHYVWNQATQIYKHETHILEELVYSVLPMLTHFAPDCPSPPAFFFLCCCATPDHPVLGGNHRLHAGIPAYANRHWHCFQWCPLFKVQWSLREAVNFQSCEVDTQ